MNRKPKYLSAEVKDRRKRDRMREFYCGTQWTHRQIAAFADRKAQVDLQRARECWQHHANVSGEPILIVHATEEHAKLIAAMFGVEWEPDEKGNQRIGMYQIMTESIYL